MPGGEWKDARASERKAAEWIYLKIAHQRALDPLLVTLDSPTEGRVRVFPVSKGEPREVELKVRLPEALEGTPVVRFPPGPWYRTDGTCGMPAPVAADGGICVAPEAGVSFVSAGWIRAHRDEAVALPVSEAEPVVFAADDPDLVRKLRRFQRAKRRQLEAEGADAVLPRAEFRDAAGNRAGKPADGVVSEADRRMLLREFPELPWHQGEGDSVAGWFFLPREGGGTVPVPCPPEDRGALVFAPVAGAVPVEGAWAEGAKAWALEERAFRYPGEDHRAELLALTRKCGVLTTQSAYVVLENTIQEKELSLDEKRALAGNKEMEFHETAPEPPVPGAAPEPGTLALLALGAATLAAAARRRKRRTA
jgi:hypothetical protein